MSTISFVHYYEVGLDEYLELLFGLAEADEESSLNELPNVKDREEIDRCEDDCFVHATVRCSAMGNIPRKARRILKPHMLAWLEHTTFDKKGRFWDWRIEPYYFRDIFCCTGRMSLYEDGPGRTKRVTKGKIEIRFPVFGRVAEKYIIRELKKNMDAEIEMFHQNLESRSK